MSAAPKIQLQPLEWAVVAALQAHGTLTTSGIEEHMKEQGCRFSRASLKSRLHTLTRFCVIVRVCEGRGHEESIYKLREV